MNRQAGSDAPDTPPVDVAEIEHEQMRELVGLLKAVQTGPRSLTQREIADRAGAKVSTSTISRWAAATEPRYRQPKTFTRDQHLILGFLKRYVAQRDQPQDRLREIPALQLQESPLYDGIKGAIDMTALRIDALREQMPGDYLVAAFSSSWPRSFTISVMRIQWNEESNQLLSTEYQINRDPFKTETYNGVVYGKTDMRGILSFERDQGFVRHYVQEERSPRIGKLQWMKGHLLTASGRQTSFVSPFYLERIPMDEAGLFREQTVDPQSPAYEAEGATGFAIRYLCCVDPIETIASMLEKLAKYYPPPSQDDNNRPKALMEESGSRSAPSAVRFFADFLRRLEMHFLEAAEQSRYAYARLSGRPASAEQLSSLVEEALSRGRRAAFED